MIKRNLTTLLLLPTVTTIAQAQDSWPENQTTIESTALLIGKIIIILLGLGATYALKLWRDKNKDE